MFYRLLGVLGCLVFLGGLPAIWCCMFSSQLSRQEERYKRDA